MRTAGAEVLCLANPRRICHGYLIMVSSAELDDIRINFLPEKRRKQAVAEMIDHARSKGVNLSRPPRGFPV